MAGIKNLIGLIRRALDFIKRNGLAGAFARIQLLFKFTKSYSYRTILEKFPQRFIASTPVPYIRIKAIDNAACIALQTLKDRLQFQQDPSQILFAFRKTLGADRYYRLLTDLFTLEQIISTASPETHPIVQSSELPELHTNPSGRRILFITAQAPSPYHGGGNRLINFIKILSEANEVWLATGYNPQHDDEALATLSFHCRSILRIPYWRFGNNQTEIHDWLKNTSIDIVHYEWLDALQNYDATFGRIHIFTYMEAVSLRLLMDLEKDPLLSHPWLDTFSRFLSALRTEIVDTIPLTTRIAVTTKDAKFLKSIYPHQDYAVLNHGVSLDDFSLPDIEPEPKTLVFVGNFGHYPNVDAMTWFFSNVWDEILKAEPHTRIYLVGPNPPETITRLADGKKIIVTGGVPDVRPYIQKAAICIAPLISGAGLRGKVIEYAALKRTFVATSIATEDLVYRDELEYLKADTAREFADKIILLLRDGKLVERMVSAIYETTRQNYDARRLTNFLYRLYNHLEGE